MSWQQVGPLDLSLNSNKFDMGYAVEVDCVNSNEWNNILQGFKDASLDQTWAYGKTRWGEKNLSHLIIKKGNNVIGASQLRIIKIALINAGIAYVANGPIWQRKGEKPNINNLRQILKALKFEYADKRSLYLRIIPNIVDDELSNIASLFEKEGFERDTRISPYKTFLINLAPSLEELHKNLHRKWRENLRRANRSGLTVMQGTDDRLFNIFVEIYKEMLVRKKFISFYDVNCFRTIQKRLPETLKMEIMVCKKDGKSVTGLIWSKVGDTGIPIFSATGNMGLKVRGAYLLRWQMLEQLKAQRYSYFDQGGVDRDKNPGGYHFKSRMGGYEVSHIGQFEICNNLLSLLIVKASEIAYSKYKIFTVFIRKMLSS